MSKSVTTVRKATVSANRYSSGKGDGFRFDLYDVNNRSTISFCMTPEQWALAMWGRGDIEVDVEWTNAAPTSDVNAAPEEWTALRDLPPGFLFRTRDGGKFVRTIKQHAPDEWTCIDLGSGLPAYFNGDAQVCQLPKP